MKFQQVMAFFLTGATALSMSTTALAADLPDNVDTTVSTTQTADEQENNLYTKNDKDLTDAEFEQKYELPENSWFTPAVRYVIENNIMLPAGHIDGKEYFPWFNPAENRCTVAEAIYNSAKLVDPELTASYAGMAVKEAPDYAEIPELYRDGASFCFESGIMTGEVSTTCVPMTPSPVRSSRQCCSATSRCSKRPERLRFRLIRVRIPRLPMLLRSLRGRRMPLRSVRPTS